MSAQKSRCMDKPGSTPVPVKCPSSPKDGKERSKSNVPRVMSRGMWRGNGERLDEELEEVREGKRGEREGTESREGGDKFVYISSNIGESDAPSEDPNG